MKKKKKNVSEYSRYPDADLLFLISTNINIINKPNDFLFFFQTNINHISFSLVATLVAPKGSLRYIRGQPLPTQVNGKFAKVRQ